MPLDAKALDLIAERFRLLGDVTRLRLLAVLGQGERSVAELVTAVGANQANVSKHLGLLARAGFLSRRKEGLRVLYSVADPRVFELCQSVCGSLSDRLEQELSAFRELPPPAPPRRRR
jgi:ArsR family transcriptional regulator